MQIKNFNRILIYIILLILIGVNRLSDISNEIGILLFFLYLLNYFIFTPEIILENIIYFFILIPMLLGGYLCENGIYLFETNIITYKNGTFLYNLLFCLIFIDLIGKNIKFNKKIFSGGIKISDKFYEVLLIISILILYIYFFKTGIPIFKGVHRTIYFAHIVPNYINFIKGRVYFLVAICSYYYFQEKKKRFLFYFFMIVLYHILCSIKGGELITVIYFFTLPNILHIRNLKKDKLRFFRYKLKKIILLFGIFLFGIIILGYSTNENYNYKTTAIEKIEKRIESAAQIWWYINDKNLMERRYRIDKLLYNLNPQKSEYEKGMNQLMNEIVPKKFLNEWRKNGARGRSLANGFPAIGFYYLGYLGVIILILIIAYLVQNNKRKLLYSYCTKDFIELFFIITIIESLIRIVAQGDIQIFFQKRFIIILFFYISYSFIKKVNKSEKIE